MKIFTLPDPNPLTGSWVDRDVVAIDNQPNGHSSGLSLNSFVRITDSERSFLGQQIGLTAQCWRSIDVTDKVAVEILRQSRMDGRRTAAITEDRVNYHPLRVAGEIRGHELEMVRIRPRPGAEVEAMPAEEVSALLKLPHGDGVFAVGYANDLPITVDRWSATHHILIAGATGSGKTTLNFQLIKGAVAMGGAVVVFDHKPDYSAVGDRSGNLRLVLGRSDEALPGEAPLSVPACRLDRGLLAQTLFYGPTEKLQAESCGTALDIFAKSQEDAGRQGWTLREFHAWLRDPETKGRLTNEEGLDKRTLGAITRKLYGGSGNRIPTFVDASISSLTGRVNETFRFDELMEPGRVTVIRLAESVQDTRGYALFLSYMMRKHAEYRQAERGDRQFLMCIIDEAQDIFSGTREFREAAEHTLQKAVRKARSLNTSIVIAPQSASAIPEQIMNNLNTRFVFRHNDSNEAKTALIQATDHQRKMTEELRPGECLASIFGTRMVFEFKVDDIEPGWRMAS